MRLITLILFFLTALNAFGQLDRTQINPEYLISMGYEEVPLGGGVEIEKLLFGKEFGKRFFLYLDVELANISICYYFYDDNDFSSNLATVITINEGETKRQFRKINFNREFGATPFEATANIDFLNGLQLTLWD